VPAALETVPVASGEDAADDACIWVDRAAPERSTIMARDPSARFASGAEMADALDAAVAGGFGAADLSRIVARACALEQPPAQAVPTAVSPGDARRARWWVAGAAAVVALGALLVATLGGGEATEAAPPPAATTRSEPLPPPPPERAPQPEAEAPAPAVTSAVPAPRVPARARARRTVRPAEPAPTRKADVQPEMPIRY
jgi:hypothetical protein